MLDSVHCEGLWHVGEQGIYFFAKPDEKGRSEIRHYEFATGKARKILMLDRLVEGGLVVSPDGRTIPHPAQIDESGSDLMLVENFR